MSSLSQPPRKRRKLQEKLAAMALQKNTVNDDDDEIEIIPNSRKRRIKTTTNSNTNIYNKSKAVNDDENSDYDNDENINTKNKYILSSTDERELKLIETAINSLKATELKAFLKKLKSVKNIDNKPIFNDCKLSGKKGDLIKRINNNIRMIYTKDIKPYKRYRNKEYESFKTEIKTFISQLSDESNLSLNYRLNAYNKEEIINILNKFFMEQNDNGLLQKQFENILPSPNLDIMVKRHKSLINAIHRATPNSRWGSRRDNYCYNRCKSAINDAIKGIIDDGQKLINIREWELLLDFLQKTMENIDNFPVWDDDHNNHDVENLKKTLKGIYEKTQLGLAFNVNEEQQNKLETLELYFK